MQIDPQLNHIYTFDSFIEGDCNRVARRAGKTVETVQKKLKKHSLNNKFLQIVQLTHKILWEAQSDLINLVLSR